MLLKMKKILPKIDKVRLTMYVLSIASIILAGLKLFNVVKWDWVWILCLIWIPAVLVFIAIVFLCIIGYVFYLHES